MNQIATVQHSIKDLERMAIAMDASRLFGKATPEQFFALMLIAQADGYHPATVAREYDIIQDRPAIKSQAALARFQAAGGKIEYITRTDAECTVRLSHPQGGEITVTWDIQKAKREGLDGKDNYKKRPGVMFQWRAIAEGVRAILPGCLNGMYLSEEVQDFEPRHEPAKRPALDPVAHVELANADALDKLRAAALDAGLSAGEIAQALGNEPTVGDAKRLAGRVREARAAKVLADRYVADEIGEGAMDESITEDEISGEQVSE